MDREETDPFSTVLPKPTSARPLLGLTVLVIEDSRYACEALRLLCLRSGARIRRADSLRSARRHLQVYRPSVTIIDLGLPDGNGSELILDLSSGTPRPEVILGLSGETSNESVALEAGADGFLPKPVTSLHSFQEAILQHLPAERRPRGPRAVSNEVIEPDPIAFRDDMAHVADVIDTREDDAMLDYVAQFLGGVARSAKDKPLAAAAEELAKMRSSGAPSSGALETVAGLVKDRLTQSATII